ncbi:MAG: aldehyde dehydrogenase family protein [Gemmatimonadota bacterium]|nr:aldehyde dehydrogenase family protein [Gemmatimonadota bacterium]MDQ8147942.1 aldehyde dehydrogenase family protein [Gemmatimonadota bacterium]MDQ8177389.1 aldehyde dehydrogenase family protein [Gemmatimonadota bacterium]
MPTVTEIFETMDYGPAPEGDAEARAWLAAHTATFGHFIAGAWTKPGTTFAVTDPSTNALLARVTQGSAKDVDAAVAAARKAFGPWSRLPAHARARHLYALARMVQKHSRLFAVLETLDNGKSIRETRDLDIPLVARHFYHHAGWAQLRPAEFDGYGPVGVVGQVIPWNFPLLMLAWKVAPALAAGNTVVLKPAEYTPLTALLFAELAHQAGLPAGVLNVLTGDGRTGAALVEHRGINKVAFTGSTEVGRIIRKATAGSGKKLSLELGGKSPFIVYEDADLDAVVEGVVDAIWFNQGQVCCAGSRLLVQEGVHDRLIAKLQARMETLRVGPPLDKAIDMGAIVSPEQLARIRTLCATGQAEGAQMWQPSTPVPTTGCYFPPTLFTEVAPASTIAQEEIFGPVLVAMSFRTPEESVSLANNTPYGLAASVWTENVNLALDIAPKLRAGVVWVNATNLFDAAAGFGGYRESGYGREGGREGMWEYLAPVAVPAARAGRGAATRRATKTRASVVAATPVMEALPAIDRTPKLFIGGKQARPDAGYVRVIVDPKGRRLGEVGEGNRKDLRNAVEAARAAVGGWSRATAHLRAQILYYVAENLSARRDEFATRVRLMTGATAAAARAEVETSIDRLFTYGAWADKWDGAVHHVPIRGIAIAMPEAIGVVGVAAPDEAPLLGLISTIAPLIATGNAVVAIPSEPHPLAATDLYTIFESSDVPAGVVNLVTGAKDALATVLAAHDDVESVWYWGTAAGRAAVESASAGNLKRTWCHAGPVDWTAAPDARAFLREATHVKNIWVPYGE